MLDHEKGWYLLMKHMDLSQGFSLIELMIGIVIFSILVTLAMPTYNAFVQNTMVRTTAESIINGLQVARAEAVKRNAQVRFRLGTNSSWSVGCVVTVADNDGDGVDDCPAIIQNHATGEGSSSSITVVATPSSANTVIFSNLGTVNFNASTMTRVDIDVSTSKLPAADSRELRVTIGAGGAIRMCDPNVSQSTDTRKC